MNIKVSGVFCLAGLIFIVLKGFGYLTAWSWWWSVPLLLGDIVIFMIVLGVLTFLKRFTNG